MKMIDKFIWWYNDEFKQTDLYCDMVANSELSPWHMEHSIAVHTDMVVTQYLIATGHDFENNIHGAFACAFHDVGKPASRIQKHSPERGDYSAFHGHERVSARVWEDFAVCNLDTLSDDFGFTKEDIFKVGFLIEQHKPWDLKDPQKLQHLAYTLEAFNIRDQFANVLNADTSGRVTDDLPSKIESSKKWFAEFVSSYNGTHQPTFVEDGPVLYVSIAAAGSGKSTYRNTLREITPDLVSYSFDDIRLERYAQEYLDLIKSPPGSPVCEKDVYAACFKSSIEDPNFNKDVKADFMKIIKAGQSVYLDNVNTSKKSRRFFIDEARKRGYRIEAVTFPISISTIIERQRTRPDKVVPDYVVYDQYIRINLPQMGEFDTITVVMDEDKIEVPQGEGHFY